MYVGNSDDKERIPQHNYGTENTVLRVLIDRDDGAQKFAMRIISVEPGGHIGLHNHPYEHEIFVLNGEGEVRTDKNTAELRPGRFCWIPPDEPHSFYNTGDVTLDFICCIPKRPGMENTGS